ncbi:hypothetical protein CV093_05310 [Oceanobacillus sp. 143]|nr:hypothetical protein CV093_05310 [Oceanobacillus sp. 143]
MEAGMQPNTFGDWAELEGERSRLQDWQLSLLKEWHSGGEPNEILNVLKSILTEFIKAHKGICEKVGCEEDPEWVEKFFGMVL